VTATVKQIFQQKRQLQNVTNFVSKYPVHLNIPVTQTMEMYTIKHTTDSSDSEKKQKEKLCMILTSLSNRRVQNDAGDNGNTFSQRSEMELFSCGINSSVTGVFTNDTNFTNN